MKRSTYCIILCSVLHTIGRVMSNKNYFDSSCSLMTAKISGLCEKKSYGFHIWDEKGVPIFISSIDSDEDEYSFCYDPSKCYSIEFNGFLASDCPHEVLLNGTKVVDDVGQNLVRFGNCSQCKSKTEVVLINQFYGKEDVNFTFFAKGVVNHGFLANGHSANICIGLDYCNILTVNSTHWIDYYLVKDNKMISYDVMPRSKMFGQCSNCTTSFLVYPMFGEPIFNYTLQSKNSVRESAVKEGNYEITCIDATSNCYSVRSNGKAHFLFYEDEKLADIGLSFDYSFFGSCDKKCHQSPILYSTERGKDIISAISYISNMMNLQNIVTPEYQAACWLIYDDVHNLQSSAPRLLQRYIVALMYYSTKGSTWNNNWGHLGTKTECDWYGIKCNQGQVIEIKLSQNNLQGKLISELFYLNKLETLDLSMNKLIGTFPIGMSKIGIKILFISNNNLHGNLPDDFFSTTSLKSVDLSTNQFSGFFPKSVPSNLELHEFFASYNFFSGTIPGWISEAKHLKTFLASQNVITGTISDNALSLFRLERLWLDGNILEGPIPGNIFESTSLFDLRLHYNGLTGVIPSVVTNQSKMLFLHLNDNRLRGGVPPSFSRFFELNELILSNNKLSGSFPDELSSLHKLVKMRVEHNNILGNIPFTECDQFVTLSADCDLPRNISCHCCKSCFGLYTSYNDTLQCPSTELKVVFHPTPTNNWIDFYLENNDKQLYLENTGFSYVHGNSFKTCISSTDCFYIKSIWSPDYDVLIDDKAILTGMTVTSEARFGYSSEGKIMPGYCDDYQVCDRKIMPGTVERRLINMITRFSGLKMFKNENQYQKAMCWWLNDLYSRNGKVNYHESMLIQRYLLALIYFSNGGAQWHITKNWISQEPECTWYGISCEVDQNIISKVDLSSNNLKGTMVSEIGELRGLEYLALDSNGLEGLIPKEIIKAQNLMTLKLSDNKLKGRIPVEMKYLTSIKELDLSMNRLTSAIPSELGAYKDIEYLDLSLNSFSGDLSENFKHWDKLNFLNLSSNFFYGNVDILKNLTSLDKLDLSDNYFSGYPPLYNDIKIIKLNNNQFQGSISTIIGNMQSLEQLYLQNNELTGRLPTEIGFLKNLTQFSISHNNIKGSITDKIYNLHNLDLLHLHSNQLTGQIDSFNYSIQSFITDCGNTETSPSLVSCPDCTECCNIEDHCISDSATWPRRELVTLIPPSLYVIFITLLTAGISFIFMYALSLHTKKPFASNFAVRMEFQRGSVNRFLLSSFKIAWFATSISTFFQIWIIFSFMQAGDKTYEYNEYLYSVTCSGSSLECKDSRQINIIGWVTYGGIIASFLLSDMLESFAVIKESFIVADPKGMFAGFLLLSITLLSIVASTIYIHATSLTNMAMIKDAVIALFLNAIDGEIYSMICKVSPSWIDQVQADITNSLLAQKEKEISEIVDMPSPLSEYSNPWYDDGKGNENENEDKHDDLSYVLKEEPNITLKQYIQDQIFEVCRDRDSKLSSLQTEVLALRKELDESKDEVLSLRKELDESIENERMRDICCEKDSKTCEEWKKVDAKETFLQSGRTTDNPRSDEQLLLFKNVQSQQTPPERPVSEQQPLDNNDIAKETVMTQKSHEVLALCKELDESKDHERTKDNCDEKDSKTCEELKNGDTGKPSTETFSQSDRMINNPPHERLLLFKNAELQQTHSEQSTSKQQPFDNNMVAEDVDMTRKLNVSHSAEIDAKTITSCPASGSSPKEFTPHQKEQEIQTNPNSQMNVARSLT